MASEDLIDSSDYGFGQFGAIDDYDDNSMAESGPMHILDLADIDNVAEYVDQTELDRIGAEVIRDYDTDKQSMSDWMDRNRLAMKLIDMKPEQKTDPWPGAAATKLPLVLNAAMKASAEEYAEVMRGDQLVKTKIFGRASDEKISRSNRVKKRMNYQFFYELEDWLEDHDKLILSKNIIGTVHKKYFYSQGKIQCVLRRSGVVINDNVERLTEAPRVSDEIDKYWWQAEEKFRDREWIRIELTANEEEEYARSDKLNRFIEQIRREDLDNDGYPEPYVVTVHERTKKVVRITPNYTPESIFFEGEFDVAEYQMMDEAEQAQIKEALAVNRVDDSRSRVRYVKYDMIPSWEGGYWGFGFGILLGPLNENCNQVINHLLNSGHLANNGGGFINAGIKMQSGELHFRHNEWKTVQSHGMDLSRNIVPLPVREPSQTLFSLLGLLMDVLKDLSSVTEVMSGEQPRANMPAQSVMALIEQGKKMFNSVYKRHYRALSKEMLALFDLNFLYEDPQKYLEFHDLTDKIDPRMAIPLIQGDYEREGLDVLPTANPEFSSKLQRLSEAQALLQVAEDPRVDRAAVLRMYIKAIVDDEETIEAIIPKEPKITPEQQAQQIAMEKEKILADNEVRKSEAEAKEAEIKLQEAQVKLQKAMIEAQKAGMALPHEVRQAELKNDRAEIEAMRELYKDDVQQTDNQRV